MNLKLWSTLIFLIFFYSINNAQTDSKELQDTIATISFSSKNKYQHKSKIDYEKNVVKFPPFGFSRGRYIIYYEREMCNFFSIQVGLGLTGKNFTREDEDFATNRINNKSSIIWDNGSTQNIIDENINYDYEYRKARLGYNCSLEPRFYLSSDGMEGFYCAGNIEFYKYFFESYKIFPQSNIFESRSANTIGEHEHVSEFAFLVGYQSHYNFLSLDLNIGGGYRNFSGLSYALGLENGSNIYLEGISKYAYSKYFLGLKFRIGYLF